MISTVFGPIYTHFIPCSLLEKKHVEPAILDYWSVVDIQVVGGWFGQKGQKVWFSFPPKSYQSKKIPRDPDFVTYPGPLTNHLIMTVNPFIFRILGYLGYVPFGAKRQPEFSFLIGGSRLANEVPRQNASG